MTSIEEVTYELSRKQAHIERLLVDALIPIVANSARRHSRYDRAQTLRDLLALSTGRDCNYDRPSIGAAYACWYQPRRISDGLRMALPTLCGSDGDVELLDLGCGTGALWWAVAAAESIRAATGAPLRQVRIRALDSSPAMLTTARRLWIPWTRQPLGPHQVRVDAELASWLDRPPAAEGATAMLSYVFDSSDQTRLVELAGRLSWVLAVSGAGRAVVATAATKRAISTATRDALSRSGEWAAIDQRPSASPFHGSITELSAVRSVMTESNDHLNAEERRLAAVAPTWRGTETVVFELERALGRQLSFGSHEPGRLSLDDEQEAAATPSSRPRPTAILGSAGSGKSRILVERLTREIERRGGARSILVTAFNERLIDELCRWFIETRPNGLFHVRSDRPGLSVVSGTGWTVEFCNFHKVLHQHLGVRPTALSSTDGSLLAVRDKLGQTEVASLESRGFRFPDFFHDEFLRVVYGLEALEKEQYLDVSRRGRLVPASAADRRAIWSVLDHQIIRRTPTWVHPRIEALKNVLAGRVKPAFDALFVDECQDFVPADFKLFNAILRSPTGLVVFGDGAQALHVGSSHWLPTFEGGRWRRLRLSGSYRLPLKTCDAVRPLSGQIALHRQRAIDGPAGDPDTIVPRTVKAATPGTRPIVLAGDIATICRHLTEIAAEYAPFADAAGARRITIAEQKPNSEMSRTLSARLADWTIEAISMQSIKGLERAFVVWQADTKFPTMSTVAEWVFTILTRSTAVTVIALTPTIPPATGAVLARLDRTKLMFWTPAAETAFDKTRNLVEGPDDPLRTRSLLSI